MLKLAINCVLAFVVLSVARNGELITTGANATCRGAGSIVMASQQLQSVQNALMIALR